MFNISLSNLSKDNLLHFTKKPAKNNFTNYIIHPKLQLTLYNPKIVWIDKFKQNISLSFKRSDNLSLLQSIKTFDKILSDSFLSIFNIKINPTSCYEKNDYFYIKCYLPTKKITIEESPENYIQLPPKLINYDKLTLNITNIWINDKLDYYGINYTM